jgi:hypothetical protein
MPIIEKTADLFLRIDVVQAEIVIMSMFITDALKKKRNVKPTEVKVFRGVLDWKHEYRPSLTVNDAINIATTIRNLGMLRWLDIEPDPALPFLVAPEDEDKDCITKSNK